MCAGCGKEILDRVCNALDKSWHVACFTCTTCKQPFSGKIFEKGGKPYCEEHVNTAPGRRALPPLNVGDNKPGSRRIPPRRSTQNSTATDDIVLRNPESPRSKSRQRPVSLQAKLNPAKIMQNDFSPTVPAAPSTRKLPSTPPLNLGPVKSRGSSSRVGPPIKRQTGGSAGTRSPKKALLSRSCTAPVPTAVSPVTEVKAVTQDLSYAKDPEFQLADKVIKDLNEHLPWFSDMWDRESNKSDFMKVLVSDIRDALVNTSKKSTNIQVKSWTRSPTSLNIEITPETLKQLTDQTEPLFQNISNLMAATYNISMQHRVNPADIRLAISNIHCIGTNILTVTNGFCSMEMLSTLIEDTIKKLQEASSTGEPMQDILNAAKSALKPMRIHNLVVQNVQNSLENLRSMAMQLIYTIRSITDNVIVHRKAVDIICGVRNIMELNKIFISEIATLFELERSGLLRNQQQQKQTSQDSQEDLNIYKFLDTVDTSQWPELSGNLNSLVLQLTSVESFDSSFQKSFITTYRSFTTPEKLWSKLLERYRIPDSYKKDKTQIQLRVAIILKYWIETQIRDFDDMLIRDVRAFIEGEMEKSHPDVAGMLKNTLKQSIENDNKKPTAALLKISRDLAAVSPTDLFLQSSARDMAEQLTLISSTIYRKINVSELLSQAWSKPKTRHKCPNVTALIQRFNQFSFWVPSMILSFESLRERSQAITKFIEIGEELRELQNFDGIMGIVAGLTMSPVSRLNFSKLTVNEKLLKSFEALEDSMQPSQSWKVYRQTLQSCTTAAVPYLGMYLTDLTFIADGNPDFNKTPDGQQLINFRKYNYIYNVLAEIQVYQSQSYPIEPKEPLATYLRYLPHLSDDVLYKMSLQREPRGATIKDLIS